MTKDRMIEAMAKAISGLLDDGLPWTVFKEDAAAAFAALPLPCQHGQELLAALRVAEELIWSISNEDDSNDILETVEKLKRIRALIAKVSP